MPKNLPQGLLNLCSRIVEMMAHEGLTRMDLVATFIAHRVMPL